MAGWLTPAWVEASAAAAGAWPVPAGDGPAPAPVILTVTVTGAADGDVTYERRWWPGPAGPRGHQQGPAGPSGHQPGPERERRLAVTLPVAEARAVLSGELDPSVAFMRGRMKTSGDPGAVLDVLAAAATPEFSDLLGRVRCVTDF